MFFGRCRVNAERYLHISSRVTEHGGIASFELACAQAPTDVCSDSDTSLHTPRKRSLSAPSSRASTTSTTDTTSPPKPDADSGASGGAAVECDRYLNLCLRAGGFGAAHAAFAALMRVKSLFYPTHAAEFADIAAKYSQLAAAAGGSSACLLSSAKPSNQLHLDLKIGGAVCQKSFGTRNALQTLLAAYIMP